MGWHCDLLCGTPLHPWRSSLPPSPSICQTFPGAAIGTASGLGYPDPKENFFVAEKCLHLCSLTSEVFPWQRLKYAPWERWFHCCLCDLADFPGLSAQPCCFSQVSCLYFATSLPAFWRPLFSEGHVQPRQPSKH